jgi:hypothetical protein
VAYAHSLFFPVLRAWPVTRLHTIADVADLVMMMTSLVVTPACDLSSSSPEDFTPTRVAADLMSGRGAQNGQLSLVDKDTVELVWTSSTWSMLTG